MWMLMMCALKIHPTAEVRSQAPSVYLAPVTISLSSLFSLWQMGRFHALPTSADKINLRRLAAKVVFLSFFFDAPTWDTADSRLSITYLRPTPKKHLARAISRPKMTTTWHKKRSGRVHGQGRQDGVGCPAVFTVSNRYSGNPREIIGPRTHAAESGVLVYICWV